MRIKINRPVRVVVNGQLRQFYRGETVNIPEESVRRIERLLAGRRIPEALVSAPVSAIPAPLEVAGVEAVEPDAGEGEAAPPPVAPLASDSPSARPKTPRKPREKKA